MKYVLFAAPGCVGHVFVFDDTFKHTDVAQMMRNTFCGIIPISAGFISIDRSDYEKPVTVWGESISLGLKSRGEEDVRKIKILLDLNS